jgi:hypothetical protein
MPKFFKNMTKFKVVSILTSLLYFYLFISLFFSPAEAAKDFGIPGTESAFFVARRASMLMLGFAVLVFLIRNIPASTIRQAIAFSIGVNMAGFAIMSIWQLASGLGNPSYIVAAFIEVVISVSYFYFCIADRLGLTKA